MSETKVPFDWVDSYVDVPDMLVLTQKELPIPGVRTFGWRNRKKVSSALPPHFHKNCFELTFVFKGSVLFYTTDTQYEICGGEAFLTRPDVAHSTNNVPLSISEIFWIQLDGSDPSNFLFLSEDAAHALLGALYAADGPHIRADNIETQSAAKTFVEAVARYAGGEDVYRIAADLVFFLYRLLDCANATDKNISQDISRVCKYIQEHLCAEMTLQELAQEGGLSVSQFKYKFKQQTGISPRNYINHLKIEQIKKRIAPGTKFTDLAYEYGFCNSSYFSAVFKKYVGMTPSAYLLELTNHRDKIG